MRLIFAMTVCGALAACSDPIADVPRLSDQNIPDTNTSIEIAASPDAQDGGLFQRLLGAPSESLPPADIADAVAADVANGPEVVEPVKRTGFFARLTGSQPQPKAALAEPTQSDPAGDVIEVSAPDPAPGNLFGRAAKPQSAPAAVSEIAPGTLLPYGRVARICGLAKRELGKKIAQYPEKSPRHRIYDSDPGNTAPHSFFITGFDDGCARQFTASLALFGPVAMHEQLRYGLPSEVQPYSDTDKAYEKLKSKVCGVPRKKPCGSKVSKLDRSTVFVSIYERFGSNPSWTNLLLHDGDVLAQDKKVGG